MVSSIVKGIWWFAVRDEIMKIFDISGICSSCWIWVSYNHAFETHYHKGGRSWIVKLRGKTGKYKYEIISNCLQLAEERGNKDGVWQLAEQPVLVAICSVWWVQTIGQVPRQGIYVVGSANVFNAVLWSRWIRLRTLTTFFNRTWGGLNVAPLVWHIDTMALFCL